MGSCSSIIRPLVRRHTGFVVESYLSNVILKIKSKTESQETIATPVSIFLTKSLNARAQSFKLDSEIFVTGCTLPGLDLHTMSFSKCLDHYIELYDGSSILIGLFDGHGPDGSRVVSFCCNFVSAYYNKRKELLKDSPLKFLENCIEDCDESLRNPKSRIDTDYSGTTGLFVLIKDKKVYSASVGDSRAVLATYSNIVPLIQTPAIEENIALIGVKKQRKSISSKKINYLQLTRDHRPNDIEEANRIIGSRGRIKRLQDSEGNKIGPCRVWESETNMPGLDVTRSIGDNMTKSIGVIAVPDITVHEIDSKNDLFIVLGTDGLWDVMDNEDVVDFVGHYREKTSKTIEKHNNNPDLFNSCIAQILCEEARVRWFPIVEEDDANIDNISCIVLEFNKKYDLTETYHKKNMKKSDLSKLNDDETVSGVFLDKKHFKDPKRSCQINILPDSLPLT